MTGATGGDLPVIDIGPLVAGQDDPSVGRALDAACRETGFFYIVGHGVDEHLQADLDRLAREFFARPEAEKAEIAMERGGRAWRGWFPVGGELTSGVPDRKEGIYFGAELPADHPLVEAGTPMHGPNLFPRQPAGLRAAVLAYIDALTALGHRLMRGLALGLGLEPGWFARHLTTDPLVLFRIFHYPPDPEAAAGAGPPAQWGVGEHTDYGLITILRQDRHAGLQVHGQSGWIDAPPIPNAFVCNLGDMLERMTAGRYRSTPHRVLNTTGASRLSFPFFFDPAWTAEVRPAVTADGAPVADDRARWDGASVHDFAGTYGDYVTAKVAKVFPDLAPHASESGVETGEI